MGYVLTRRYVGSSDDRWASKPISDYTAVDVFDGNDAYGDADRERSEQQVKNPDYVYEIFTQDEWNAR